MDEPEEQLNLVDADDNVIGIIDRHEVLELEPSGRGFTRAVGVFLINSQGQLWIPRRQETKKIAPGGLDFSAGEHVGAGESYEVAALRGLREELGIDEAEVEQLRPVGRVPPFSGMPYFHHIFLYHSDTIPSYNPADYSGYEWLHPHQAAEILVQGEPAKEILLPSVQLLLQHQPSIGATR